jgi:hypothetical protein
MTSMEDTNGHRPTYRRAAALALFFVYVIPGTAVMAINHAARPADPVSRSFAVLGVGIGGYALLFVLLVFAVPRLLKRAGRENLALHWRCAAFHASIWSSIITVLYTLPKVQVGGVGARITVAAVAAGGVFAALDLAKRRYFDGPCGQLRGWPRL